MSESFTLATVSHRAFGVLATVALPGQPERRFTRDEARAVSRAIVASAQAPNGERQIYMSPIACDCDFDGCAREQGLLVTLEDQPDAALSWPEALALARALERFSSEGEGVSE